MSFPNLSVIKALFESYVSIRMPTWGLKEDGNIDTLTGIPLYKLTTALSLAKEIQSVHNIQHWINFLYLLGEKEKYEEVNKTGNRLFGFASYVVDEPLLLQTIRAAKSYIIANIKDFELYKKTVTKLQSEANDLNTQKLKALSDVGLRDYHSHFQAIIKRKDKKSIELKENSFEDFEKNAANGLRPPVISNHLMQQLKNDEAKKDKVTVQNAIATENEKKNPVTVTSSNLSESELATSSNSIYFTPASSLTLSQSQTEVGFKKNKKETREEKSNVSPLISNSTFNHKKKNFYPSGRKTQEQPYLNNHSKARNQYNLRRR